MEVDTSNLRSTVILSQGYRYHQCSEKNGTRYMVCSQRKNICFARGIIYADVEGFRLTRPHNHAPNVNAELIEAFKEDLYQAVLRTPSESLKAVYDTCRLLHPEATKFLPFPMIESSLYRWKKSVMPPLPDNMQEYVNTVNDRTWISYRSYYGGVLEFSHKISPDGSEMVIICSPQTISLNKLFNVTDLHVDATFKCVPACLNLGRSGQLLTVMGIQYAHGLPFCWALMSRRSRAAYETLFAYLKEKVGLDPKSIMCDFEQALYMSLSDSFPNAVVHGCFFHYSQALIRQAKRLGVFFFFIIKHSGSNDIQTYFATWFDYIQTTWINGVTANLFSVFKLENKTNNCIEAYHRMINCKLRTHPNIWMFTQRLLKLQATTYSDFSQLERGHSVTRNPKLKYIINDAHIRRNWRELESGANTLAEFVENCKHFMPTLSTAFSLDVNLNELLTGDNDADLATDDFPLVNAADLRPNSNDRQRPSSSRRRNLRGIEPNSPYIPAPNRRRRGRPARAVRITQNAIDVIDYVARSSSASEEREIAEVRLEAEDVNEPGMPEDINAV